MNPVFIAFVMDDHEPAAIQNIIHICWLVFKSITSYRVVTNDHNSIMTSSCSLWITVYKFYISKCSYTTLKVSVLASSIQCKIVEFLNRN